MKLQLVTKDQAVKLKKLGFNCTDVGSYYNLEVDQIWSGAHENMNAYSMAAAAPSTALAIKWLRDIKKISVEVRTNACQWEVSVVNLQMCYNEFYEDGYMTYDEAESAGLDNALYELLK